MMDNVAHAVGQVCRRRTLRVWGDVAVAAGPMPGAGWGALPATLLLGANAQGLSATSNHGRVLPGLIGK